MYKVFIGIGSNLIEPAKQIQRAVDSLKKIRSTRLLTVSSLYCSKPMGPQDQPDYMNAVACLQTTLKPLVLLDELQAIETLAGRIRKDERWGARVLDLDMLLYDNEIINSERLIVPHYGMKVREFVIYPLVEIAPELILPDGINVTELKNNLPENDLVIIGDLH